ncbi:MAG: acyl-CoA thioesterase [Solirubrobacteraceae bacterium]
MRPHGAGLRGESPSWFGSHVFGGILLAQTLHAASSSVSASGMRARSLHAYFLAAAEAASPLDYEVAAIRDGRSTRTRAVTVSQDGSPVLSALCTFAADRPGREYDVECPHELPGAAELDARPTVGPFELAFIGPTPPRADGTREQTHRAWVRITEPLGDQERMHEAALAFIGDLTWTAATPWRPEGRPDRSGMVSVDHAAWFHRPARADAWLLYMVQALVHAGGRGTIRGILYDEQRRIVCSTAQELQFRDENGVTTER